MRFAWTMGLTTALAGCASTAATNLPRTNAAAPVATASSDTLPVGRGSLRQEDIALDVNAGSVRVRLIPLDERVLRTLAPDSYRAVHAIERSKADEVAAAAQAHALRERNAWYVTFTGLDPQASFSPGDVTFTRAGQPFTPLAIIPLSSAFGSGRVGLRESVGAIYLFGDGLDALQPLSVDVASAHSDEWANVLHRVAQETNRILR